MMKKIFFLLALLAMPLQVFAANAAFNASIDSDHVVAGEGFTLQLDLSGAKPKGDPDFALLSSAFDIESQGNTSETSIINGHISSSQGWQLILMPKQTGHITIPALSVDTDQGRLATQPIALEVGAAPQSTGLPHAANPHAGRDVTISAMASKADPYEDQPIIYTLRIVTHVDIADLSLGDATADNAIVRPLGKPVASDTLQNGVQTKIIDIRYLVTPVRAGRITLAPVTLHGSIESEVPTFPSGFNQNGFIDPMAMLQQMGHFGDFMSRKPFSIASNAVALDVKAPVSGVDPWLPLTGLRIEEHTDLAQGAKVGEPITRKFTLIADGMDGSQLPSLEPQLQSGDVKIYADKPKTDEKVDPDTGDIIGHREESYNVIPLKSGQLELPPVKLAWWDTKNDRIAYAEAPAHGIDVLPGTASAIPNPDASQNSAPVAVPAGGTSPPAHQDASRPLSPLWYGAIILLFILFAGIAAVALRLHRQVNRLKSGETATEKDSQISNKVSAPPADIKWEQIHSPEELNRNLQSYAHRRWNTPPNAPVDSTLMQRQAYLPAAQDREQLNAVIRDLTSALYAGRQIDLEDIKEKCRHLLAAFDKSVTLEKDRAEKLPGLNPS